jgi:hypothetical protein
MAMSYKHKLQAFASYYMDDLPKEGEHLLCGQFELVSAGLVNYLPAIDVREHAFIYRQLLLHQQLSVLEQHEPAVLNKISCEGSAEECLLYLKTKPAIVCTMHTGSYRVLNLFMLQQGVPFTLVAGKNVLQKEGDDFKKIYRLNSRNDADELQMINAEDRHAGLQMLRSLKSGRSLVLYMDGHSGAGAKTNENANSCVVNFLNQQLYVRKGIAYLAHAAKVPIVPVLCYRKSIDDIRLLFYPVLVVNDAMNRDEFAISTTQQLYNLFSELIATYPEQWEGWLTIQQSAKIINKDIAPRSNKGENILFDGSRFGIFKTGGLPFLLEKREYLFYTVEEELYEILLRCRHVPIKSTEMSKDVLPLLLEKGVVMRV